MKWLDRAAELAAQVPIDLVRPNPRVGCVITRDDEVVATGVHEVFGGAHAEAAATQDFENLNGCTVWVTLEPCDDFEGKKTPSCTKRLIAMRPNRVVVGALDPQFCGKNLEKIRAAGIDVELVDHAPSRVLLAERRPWVIAKIATTLDGKISKNENERTTISSKKSRELVHRWRASCGAVLTSTRTVAIDDPVLDARLCGGVVPDVLIFGKSDVAADAKIFTVPGRRVLRRDGENVATDLQWAAEQGIGKILTECGSTLLWELLRERVVDELRVFVAPRFFGRGVAGWQSEIDLSEFRLAEATEVGGDVLLRFQKFVHCGR